MKTLEEIKAHLITTVYDEESKQNIAGFLIGKEIGKEEGLLDMSLIFPKVLMTLNHGLMNPKKNIQKPKFLKMANGLI